MTGAELPMDGVRQAIGGQINPTQQVTEPEEIAKMIAFLISDETARTVTGANWVMDSGLSLTNDMQKGQ